MLVVGGLLLKITRASMNPQIICMITFVSSCFPALSSFKINALKQEAHKEMVPFGGHQIIPGAPKTIKKKKTKVFTSKNLVLKYQKHGF